MIQKLTLTTVIRKPMTSTRTGKPYTSLSIKTKEHGDRYLSGFGSAKTDSWKEGDVVMLEVTEAEKLDKNGRPYLNWDHVDNEKIMEGKIADLDRRVRLLENKGLTSAGTPVPNFVPNTPEQEADYTEKMAGYDPMNDVNADLNAEAEEVYQRM